MSGKRFVVGEIAMASPLWDENAGAWTAGGPAIFLIGYEGVRTKRVTRAIGHTYYVHMWPVLCDGRFLWFRVNSNLRTPILSENSFRTL